MLIGNTSTLGLFIGEAPPKKTLIPVRQTSSNQLKSNKQTNQAELNKSGVMRASTKMSGKSELISVGNQIDNTMVPRNNFGPETTE